MVDEYIKWPIVGMTVEEAAEALRVHSNTIRALIKSGDLPARKVGVGWRISHKTVERWLEEAKQSHSLQEKVRENNSEDVMYTAASGEQIALGELRAGLLTIQEQITIIMARGQLSEKELSKLQYLSDMIGIFIPEAPTPVEEAEDLEGE